MAAMTLRLYYTEPWRRQFEATVTAVEPSARGTTVRLDRTAFYPTSGGQPFDTGTLDTVPVIEVVDEEDDGVAHVLEVAPSASGLAVGRRVTGVIDWRRRLDHMQQHTGQHMLSAAFEHLHHVRTESFHLGADVATIDMAREVTALEIETAQAEANRVVWDDRGVSIRFVTEQEAERLPLRKEPVKTGRLRLIEIEGFDLSACGGTHVSRTGAVGIIAVRSWERFRGGTRVAFVCGGRALAAFQALRDAVDRAAGPLSVHPLELPAAIERLQGERKELQRAVRQMGERLAGFEAEALALSASEHEGVSVVVEAVDGYDANALKTMAIAFVRRPARLAVLFSTSHPSQVIVARSADLERINCADVVRGLCLQFGGKGGGRPELAQGGGLDAPPPELVAAARHSVSGR